VDPGALFPVIAQADINAGSYNDQALFGVGLLAFTRHYTCAEGGGKRTAPGAPCVYDRLKGPEASACLDCHSVPVQDGAGSQADNIFRLFSADNTQYIERSPPHVFGVGYVELLGREMTSELESQKQAAIQQAQSMGAQVTVKLTAKGLDFGSLSADPSGVATYVGTQVQDDLVVRPFGIKGTFLSIRQQNVNALLNHMGIEATDLVGPGYDHDNDGVVDEITPGQLTAMVAYQALLAVPSFVPVSVDAQEGAAVFDSAQCSTCHTPLLRLDDPRFPLFDPLAPAGAPTMVLSLLDNGELPQLSRTATNGPVLVPLFSDLRRHDMGPALADYKDVPVRPTPLATPSGTVGARMFLSTRLWGVGSTPPYLHNATAITLDEAIRRHDGEAHDSRVLYENLPAEQRGYLLDFLNSLILQHGSGSQSLPAFQNTGGY
jgi:cytochrome c553